MRQTILFFYILSLACPVLAGGGDKPPVTSTLILRFHNVVAGRPLVLNDSTNSYTNKNGDDFCVTAFKYYISNICLIRKNGEKVSLPDTYLLINAADSASLEQTLPNIPAGKYKSISFFIGVDSLRNFAGAQTGALDPARGMFWTWNNGYIYVKMEGRSSRSTAKLHRLVFHIGGAKAPANTIRTFSQKLPRTLKIRDGHTPRLDMAVDAAALFQGKTPVDFARLNFTMGGPNSVIIADNYADGLFRVTAVKR